MPGLSAESSCPGSALQAAGVCTLPYVSDLGNRAAAGAAAAPPSDVGEAFGKHNILDRGKAGQGRGLCSLLHGPETSCGVEECHLAASQGARHADHTCSQTSCVQQRQEGVVVEEAGCYGGAQ